VSVVGVAVMGAVGDLMADAFTFVGWVLFYIWLAIIGVPLIGKAGASRRRFIAFMTSFVIGLVPLLNIVPTLLIGVTIIVISIRMEDAEKLVKYEEQLKEYNASRKASSRNTIPQRTYGRGGLAQVA